jgi:hypothetical protein
MIFVFCNTMSIESHTVGIDRQGGSNIKYWESITLWIDLQSCRSIALFKLVISISIELYIVAISF